MAFWNRVLPGIRALAARASAAGGPECVLVTKRDCPLCDEMKHELERAARLVPLRLREVALESDPELERRYSLSVPVLEIDGRPAFKGRLTAEALIEKLGRRTVKPR